VRNLIYRDYENFIVAYSLLSHNYMLIEDIFAVFFRMQYIDEMSLPEIENYIVDLYSVDSDVVHHDLVQFNNELESAINANSSCLEDMPSTQSTMQKQIFNRMTDLMIPFSATIEIIDSCNLDCIHCYRGDAKLSYWTESHFIETLTELKSMGTMNLTITGGEPFTHPLITRFLEITEKLGFVIGIQTNLILLNDSILFALKKNAISDVSVSLYSTTESEHDAITQLPGSMEKTISNIKRLIENGIPVTLNCPIMTVNQYAMVDMCKFARDLGVDVRFALKIIPSQDKSKHIEGLNAFNKDFILSAMRNPEIELYKYELENIRMSRPSNRYCQTGFRSITFDAQGNMLICNAYRKNCGSLFVSTVKELWHGSSELNLWRNKTSVVRAKCQSCPAYAYCEPCPAHSFTQSGNEESIDELTCRFGNAFYAADLEFLGKELN